MEKTPIHPICIYMQLHTWARLQVEDKRALSRIKTIYNYVYISIKRPQSIQFQWKKHMCLLNESNSSKLWLAYCEMQSHVIEMIRIRSPGRPCALGNDETLPSYSRREQGRTTWRHHWKFLFEAFDPSTVLSQISFWETRCHRHYLALKRTKVRLFKVIRRLKCQ